MELFRVLVGKWTSNVVWPLCVFAILITSATSSLPKTVLGKHCPTATIQQVSVENGSGTRAPKVGEKGFKQCCCAEQKAEQAEQAKVQVQHLEMPAALAPMLLGSVKIPILAALKPSFAYNSILHSLWALTPPVPPPNAI